MKVTIFLILSLVLVTACNVETTPQQDYEQCISFCASSLETGPDTLENDAGDFVTIELCREECEEKFLT